MTSDSINRLTLLTQQLYATVYRTLQTCSGILPKLFVKEVMMTVESVPQVNTEAEMLSALDAMIQTAREGLTDENLVVALTSYIW